MTSKKTDVWMPLYVTDYLGDTMHLNTEQHGAYLLMLMASWKTSGVLPSDDASLGAITRLGNAWKKNRDVLLSFFQIEGKTITHKRVLLEIKKAKSNSEERSKSGKVGAEKRWQKHGEAMANAMANDMANSSQNDAPSPSPSPTLLSKDKKSNASAPSRPESVDPQVWEDWLTLRKTKRAPVTKTTLSEAIKEADKAEMDIDSFLRIWCRRGSQGLEASWLKNDEKRPSENKQTALEARNKSAMDQWLKEST